MGFEKELLGVVPEGYRFPVVLVLFAIFFLYPQISAMISRHSVWITTRQNLELLKLIFEVEALEEGEQFGDLKRSLQAEIDQVTEKVKARQVCLKPFDRFKYGTLGSLIAFGLFWGYFWFDPEFASEIWTMGLGFLMLSLIGGLTAMVYRTNKKIRLMIVGAIGSVLVTMLIGILMPTEGVEGI